MEWTADGKGKRKRDVDEVQRKKGSVEHRELQRVAAPKSESGKTRARSRSPRAGSSERRGGKREEEDDPKMLAKAVEEAEERIRADVEAKRRARDKEQKDSQQVYCQACGKGPICSDSQCECGAPLCSDCEGANSCQRCNGLPKMEAHEYCLACGDGPYSPVMLPFICQCGGAVCKLCEGANSCNRCHLT